MEQGRDTIQTRAASVGSWLHETGDTMPRPSAKRRLGIIALLVAFALVTLIVSIWG